MLHYFLLIILSENVICFNYSFINLPPSHLDVYFHNNPEVAKICEEDAECPFKSHLEGNKCWGYEYETCDGANVEHYAQPHCPGDHRGWVSTKEHQIDTFFTQADFGYVKDQRRTMKVLCEPLFPDDSSLECSEYMRFCRGRNIFMNFTALASREEPIRYKMDVLKEGDIGGYCKLNRNALRSQALHVSPLQSWAPEMLSFVELPQRPINDGMCDVVIDKPTFIMKIDAAVNMYHHFCDFFNLYASLHVNSTRPDAFTTDVHILIWESYTYQSAFQVTFDAFTQNPIWDLKTFRGETVCFRNVVFPLLPRMIFGLYYNTPIIYGCENSGLFHAFSEHILHRLDIPMHHRDDDRIRVTLLSRDTKYRRIMNEAKLVEALEMHGDYVVQHAVFNRDVDFKKQLEVVRNTDVLIGMHGAGLTHLLFLPDWAAVFELYNCEDANCYMDLTRLRGLKYVTWENREKLKQHDDGSYEENGAHAKFMNYSFSVSEFLRLVKKAADHVRAHPMFSDDVDDDVDECEDNIGTIEPIDFDDESFDDTKLPSDNLRDEL